LKKILKTVGLFILPVAVALSLAACGVGRDSADQRAASHPTMSPVIESPAADTVEILRVPNVVGMSRYNAASLLRKAGFRPRETPRGIITNDSKSWQKVVAQRPVAGNRVWTGTVILLDVGFPPPGTFVRVEGSGSATVTWGNLGSTHQATVSLPWEQKVTGDTTIVSVLAQRSSGDGGSIACFIIEEGTIVKRAASSGPYAICSATY
jgi:hypothetical protein